MSVLFIVLPLALIIAAIALAAFFWAARTGQFDDLDTPAARILFDEDLKADKPTLDKPDVRRSAKR
jgi:cbb3-type cytochrome oxidase maturation protein